MVELTNSMQFMSDKMDTANSLMLKLNKEFAEINKENAELRAENNKLKSEVIDLKDTVRSLEQYPRRCNIEISGIPVTPNEDATTIVKDVGAYKWRMQILQLPIGFNRADGDKCIKINTYEDILNLGPR
ncbi:hypothetical protein J6590_059596 [Homalodisca vitripennis]|nr:hypothetical protein J6590_059596 [Homalodisca vitripennis]